MKSYIFAFYAFLIFLFVGGCSKEVTNSPDTSQPDPNPPNTELPDKMMYGDITRLGVPYTKDPHVINFKGRYLMYYSIPPANNVNNSYWGIGIAESQDLLQWKRIGEITPAPGAAYEEKGIVAPSALVIDGKVHLFYQRSKAGGKEDAICHAVSEDGLNFVRNSTNPIFTPTGDWTYGRAIDAEVCLYNDQYFLYFATRNPDYTIQMVGAAVAPKNTNFNREDWTQIGDGPILSPVLPWEKTCIEAPSITIRNGKMYMFYAGAFGNSPQQVGVAVSEDGLNWERLFKEPFLANGGPGDWNESESGHPHIFTDNDGKTYLFYQGNSDKGQTWHISNQEVFWDENNLPYSVATTGITLSQATLRMKVDDMYTLKPTIAPETASNKNVIWSSSNESIARVDESGQVTAIAEGTAIITATSQHGHKTAPCEVVVISGSVSGTSKIVFSTSRAPGENIILRFGASEADRADCWIDLNNNGTQDAGEDITVFDEDVTYKVDVPIITVYGEIADFRSMRGTNGNGITDIDVSNNKLLRRFEINLCDIDYIDFSQNSILEEIYIRSCKQISSVDVSKLTNLKFLVLESSDKIESVNLANNPLLEYLNLNYCKVKRLDISKNLAIKTIFYKGVQHTELTSCRQIINDLPTRAVADNAKITFDARVQFLQSDLNNCFAKNWTPILE